VGDFLPQLVTEYIHICLFASQNAAKKALLSTTKNSLLHLFKWL